MNNATDVLYYGDGGSIYAYKDIWECSIIL